MILFKKYSSIKNFLYRYTIIQIGKLHIRIHVIKDSDKTTLYHNHPFHYMSIVLKGGYVEKIKTENSFILKSHNLLSIIFKKNNVYHRIESVKKNTTTLFISYGNYGWQAINTEASHEESGVFKREVKGEMVWSKKENGIWFIGNKDKSIAINEIRHSIHQK